MRKQVVLGLVGAALVSWGGASISSGLDLSLLGGLSVVAFALGIVCLTRMDVIDLAARLAHLERQRQP
jgi:hypothetical protein